VAADSARERGGVTDLTTQLHELIPFAKSLGVDVLAQGKDEVRARLPWAPERCTAGGVMHGGALMALADTTGAMAAFLNLPDDAAGTTTIESKTNFLRAIRDGYAEAVSRPLHTGRTVVVVETDVLDAAGKLAARVTQTQAVLR
jgi:uncharacterized protein (TIGR00369 family)